MERSEGNIGEEDNIDHLSEKSTDVLNETFAIQLFFCGCLSQKSGDQCLAYLIIKCKRHLEIQLKRC